MPALPIKCAGVALAVGAPHRIGRDAAIAIVTADALGGKHDYFTVTAKL